MAWQTPPPIHDGEDERALKLEFAARWAQNPSRILSIGYEVFPGPENYGRAMQCQVWRHDPIVIAEYERLTGGELALVGEEEPKDRVLRKLNNLQLETTDAKVRLDAIKAEAEIEGLMGKGGNVNVNVDNRSVRNVLLVPHYESLDDFAAKLKTQQTTLLANAKSPARVTA